MPRIPITLQINDKAWADFCLWLQDNHTAGCECGGDPSTHLNNRICEEMVIVKIEKRKAILAKKLHDCRSLRDMIQLEGEIMEELQSLILQMAQDYGI